MNIKSCLFYLGLSCFPISLMSLINIFYSFYFDNLDSVTSYLSVLILSLLIGLSFFYLGKSEREKIGIYDQIFLVFLIYFSISLLILIPFYLSDYGISFMDSYFESISGLTGTGFTIFDTHTIFRQPRV